MNLHECNKKEEVNKFESDESLFFGPVRISNNKKKLLQKGILKWGKKNYISFPWRNTVNNYHALIAEMMLQRTRAEQVVKVYNLFIKNYKTSLDVYNDDPKKIFLLLEPLGLFWRAKKIIELSYTISLAGNIIPDSKNEILKLPGVGEYIAKAYLSLHRNQKGSIIDSNAARLWSRVFGFKQQNELRRKKWFLELMDYLTPEEEFRIFNYSILDFTRMICIKKPKCKICPINKTCNYFLSKEVSNN